MRVGETDDSINKKTSILLSRNIPVALVVGATGFFGSHLVDKLLSKEIQVVGVDELTDGKKNNLSKAVENKNFHFIAHSPEYLELSLDRVDYLFIALDCKLNLRKLLGLFKERRCRLLFISSVALYDEDAVTGELEWLQKAEEEIARSARDNNLNARILRLGPVYGPRMNFNQADPMCRLIAQTLSGDLQKATTLDFSSRALYIDDAVDLAIKCIFAGATAQKIFDGVLPAPIKVSEVKQVLLDPVWYESRQFTPQELPPWPTPNLEKTVKFLNWHPKTKLVENLKKTLSYFRENEINIPELEAGKEERKWEDSKKEQLEGLKGEKTEDTVVKGKVKEGIKLPKFRIPYSGIAQLLAISFVTYALIWPIINLGWGVATFRFQLLEALKSLEQGEFERSLFSIKQAELGISQAKSIFYSLEPLRGTGILKSQFELGDHLSELTTLSVDSAQNTILGIQALYESLKGITGESNESSKAYFERSQIYLAAADSDLSKAFALLGSDDFKSGVPEVLRARVESLEERIELYSGLIKKGRALSVLLPEVVALEGAKSYLVLLQNNNELRPTGGFIGSFAKISFEQGKLKKLEVNDIYAIDGQLNLHVEPPKEIKEDLGQKDYFLRDSNWEPDFPTSARQAEWFYTKETGQRVEGVIALDISAMEDLLLSVGSLDLPDYNEKINSDNLFEKAISHAEVSFFPGTQAKKSFLTALSQSLFNKLFFLPNQNWPAIVSSLGRSIEQKHMSIYLEDPTLFSYLVSQGWTNALPRPGSEKSELAQDFLAAVEANLGANKANYYLDRSYNLETVIGKDGEVSHRLRIAYTNRSPSNVFPAGKYKNRMRIYLPFGSKLTRALWGEADITRNVTSFVDYGRSGYSYLLELAPKEQKTLVLDYQAPLKLQFNNKKASYKLDVVKQAGTLKDPFVWTLTYPLNMKLVSDQAQKIGPQEQTIQTDLSRDRSFEVEFTK